MDSIPPLKRCTKCAEEKPATPEYFYTRPDSSLRAECKICFRLRSKEVQQRTPEKRRESNRRWRQRNFKPYHERDQKFKEANRARVKRWAKANSEYLREYHKRRWQSLPEEARARQRESTNRYRVAHPEKNRLHAHVYRARKRALPATFTVEQWQACLEYFHHTCVYCGAQQDFWHVLEQDHFKSLSAGGAYTVGNIVPACKSCNASKNDSDPSEWLEARFGKRKSKYLLQKIEQYFSTV